MKEHEFKVNPYDWCVVNKLIEGTQCTIAWYVDDLKLKQNVLEQIFTMLQHTFGKEAPLTVTRGTTHQYLGMTLDYSTEGKVKISMPSFVEEIISQLPPSLDGGPSGTPAANHLFQTNHSAPKLETTESDLFHRLTAQLLYLCKRARPDLQSAVLFLTTRVQSLDADDFKKLGCCIQYLRATKHLPLTLESESISEGMLYPDDGQTD